MNEDQKEAEVSNRIDDLAAFLKANPPAKKFTPYFTASGHTGKGLDILTAYFKSDPDYSVQLTRRLTVFLSLATNEIVGCRITGLNDLQVPEDDGYYQTTVLSRKPDDSEVSKATLATALSCLFRPNWLTTPNPAFDNITPLDLIARGETERVWQMIHEIDANVAN